MSSDDASGETIRVSVYSAATRRPLFWWGRSRADIRSWPRDARRIAGQQLHILQSGGAPLDRKAMPTVGLGVYEVRIRTTREYRVFYVAKFTDGIHVLHAFEKKSRTTSKGDIDLARARYRAMLRDRSSRRQK